jgi:phosphoribosylglycinamide formyltransferase 1
VPHLFSITVLISGQGSNLAAIIAASKESGEFSVGAVVSNDHSAPGLNFALDAGIPIVTVERINFSSLAEYKAAVLEAVVRTAPDLVVLAGFMMVLQPAFIETFPNRIINVHPSLLPKYPGLDTHQRAIQSGDSLHGTSIHFVDSGVDTGALIAQSVVPVYPSDTPESLKKRVQAQEYELYPWVIRNIARGEISISGPKVFYSGTVVRDSECRGYRLFNYASELRSGSE